MGFSPVCRLDERMPDGENPTQTLAVEVFRELYHSDTHRQLGQGFFDRQSTEAYIETLAGVLQDFVSNAKRLTDLEDLVKGPIAGLLDPRSRSND